MSTKRLNVALIAGGRSGEREVSLSSGAQVSGALDKNQYTVRTYDPATDLIRLANDAPDLDVALIILHGRFGEDGTIQGFLDLLDLPYQGSGVMSSALCMDKRAAKNVYRFHGLPVAKDLEVDRTRPLAPEEIIQRLGLPLVVKPFSEGSSLGTSIVKTEAELSQGLEKAFDLDRWVLVEEFLEGQEITGAVLGNDVPEALPLIEITPTEGFSFFDYQAKYTAGASREICPAPLPEDLTRMAQNLAVSAHQALYCRGYSRTDMILKNGQFFLLETNTLPGMTATSLFPQAAAAAGLSFSSLLDRLIELALEK